MNKSLCLILIFLSFAVHSAEVQLNFSCDEFTDELCEEDTPFKSPTAGLIDYLNKNNDFQLIRKALDEADKKYEAQSKELSHMYNYIELSKHSETSNALSEPDFLTHIKRQASKMKPDYARISKNRARIKDCKKKGCPGGFQISLLREAQKIESKNLQPFLLKNPIFLGKNMTQFMSSVDSNVGEEELYSALQSDVIEYNKAFVDFKKLKKKIEADITALEKLPRGELTEQIFFNYPELFQIVGMYLRGKQLKHNWRHAACNIAALERKKENMDNIRDAAVTIAILATTKIPLGAFSSLARTPLLLSAEQAAVAGTLVGAELLYTTNAIHNHSEVASLCKQKTLEVLVSPKSVQDYQNCKVEAGIEYNPVMSATAIGAAIALPQYKAIAHAVRGMKNPGFVRVTKGALTEEQIIQRMKATPLDTLKASEVGVQFESTTGLTYTLLDLSKRDKITNAGATSLLPGQYKVQTAQAYADKIKDLTPEQITTVVNKAPEIVGRSKAVIVTKVGENGEPVVVGGASIVKSRSSQETLSLETISNLPVSREGGSIAEVTQLVSTDPKNKGIMVHMVNMLVTDAMTDPTLKKVMTYTNQSRKKLYQKVWDGLNDVGQNGDNYLLELRRGPIRVKDTPFVNRMLRN